MTEQKRWVVTLEEDPDSGELILPLPGDLLKELEWTEGDTLSWHVDNDKITLSKKINES